MRGVDMERECGRVKGKQRAEDFGKRKKTRLVSQGAGEGDIIDSEAGTEARGDA